MRSWPELYIPAVSGVALPPLRLYDSFEKKLITFPQEEVSSIYVCGITPYDATHLGHAATYITFDLVQRYLLASGRGVEFIENVTDIDDPLFERANRDGQDWSTLANSQVDLFISDMTNLRVIPPIQFVKVTEAIDEIIEFVTDLVSKGLTYNLDSNLYLDLSKVTDFSDLPYGMSEAEKVFAERGGDPGQVGKKHPLDPLLWKKSGANEPHWRTPFGEGRPGWHVECNAISARLRRGATISLQGGGADLIFPHHYMTMVQGRARYQGDFANLYVHTGMISYQGQKMSKSLGNLVFVSNLISAGISPMAIRLSLMMGHYRKDREWDVGLLDEAIALHEEILGLLSREALPEYKGLLDEVADHLSRDLDTPAALQSISRFAKEVEGMGEVDTATQKSPGELSRFLDSILGLAF